MRPGAFAKNVFGWDYPPGAENDPNAPWNQQEHDCPCHCEPCSNDQPCQGMKCVARNPSDWEGDGPEDDD